ncbi:hypothetical protein, partial [Akkermansia sp.]
NRPMKRFHIKTLITACISCSLMNLSYSDQTPASDIHLVTEELKESVKNMENPISLDYRNVKTCEEMKSLIDDYIRKNHEGQIHRGTGLIREKENGKYVLVCATFNKDDKMLILSFDVTSIFHELLHSSDKKTREEIKEYIASLTS